MTDAARPLRSWFAPLTPAAWRDVVLPKEHGSWSLAFEPVALGLLAAPSAAGGWLGLATAAAFFSRRPLKIAARDPNEERRAVARSALAVGSLAAVFAAAMVVGTGGTAWLIWTLPPLVAGALFIFLDLQNAARTGRAEILGVVAFGFLPAVFLITAGGSGERALALAALMLGRSVPTVLCIRACLRAAKTGVRQMAPALFAAAFALGFGLWLGRVGLLAPPAVVMLAVLALRAAVFLVVLRRSLRARTLGLIEAVLGLAFVLAGGLGRI